MYARATERLVIRKGETAETARKKFDRSLRVESWSRPGHDIAPSRIDDAPWWWEGDEEASGSFLASMGVILT